MIGLVTATAAGREGARQLSESWPDTRTYAISELETAWAECDALVCFLAIGAAVRLVAPLLVHKHSDPAIVCVDEARRFAVAVLGGHRPGLSANDLAQRTAEAFGAEPVVTTATDAVGIAALDELGWRYEGDVAAVTRALLDGETVGLWSEAVWPLPALGTHSLADFPAAGPAIVVTDRTDLNPPTPAVLLRPPSLVVGVGASRGVSPAEVLGLISGTLAEAALAIGSVTAIATVQAKADEAGILAAARTLGVPVILHTAEELTGGLRPASE